MKLMKNKKVLKAVVGLVFAIMSAYGLSTSEQMESLVSEIIYTTLNTAYENTSDDTAAVNTDDS